MSFRRSVAPFCKQVLASIALASVAGCAAMLDSGVASKAAGTELPDQDRHEGPVERHSPQGNGNPPLSLMRNVQSLTLEIGGETWTIECMRLEDEHRHRYNVQSYAIARKNGADMGLVAPFQQPYVRAVRVDFDPGYPVFAIRGAGGMGRHWDTVFVAIRDGELVEMGRPPAMNSTGPVLWKGRDDIWAFDNYDRYEDLGGDYEPAIVLMKVTADGTLRHWRTIPTPEPNVRKTVLLPELE